MKIINYYFRLFSLTLLTATILCGSSNNSFGQCSTNGEFIWSTSPSDSSEFNWSASGALYTFFDNVDASPMNIEMQYSGNTNAFSSTQWGGVPSVGDDITGSDILQYFTTGLNNSGITNTITFSIPSTYVSFDLYHINKSNDGGDRYEISALDSLGNVVLPTITASANPSYTVDHSTGVIDANASSVSGTNAIVNVEFNDPDGIVSVTVVWKNCSTCFTNRPHGSGLGNIAFCKPAYPANLPVELTAFSAAYNNSQVEIKWTTASEINNDHFKIERSFNGKDFEQIGEVKGSGNSTQLTNYLHIDQYPRAENYYRLKQVDYDGASEYSKVIYVVGNEKPSINVWPNPFADEFQVSSANERIRSIEVFDLNGTLIQAQNVGEFSAKIDGQYLQPGTYLIRISTLSSVMYRRLIK